MFAYWKWELPTEIDCPSLCKNHLLHWSVIVIITFPGSIKLPAWNHHHLKLMRKHEAKNTPIRLHCLCFETFSLLRCYLLIVLPHSQNLNLMSVSSVKPLITFLTCFLCPSLPARMVASPCVPPLHLLQTLTVPFMTIDSRLITDTLVKRTEIFEKNNIF